MPPPTALPWWVHYVNASRWHSHRLHSTKNAQMTVHTTIRASDMPAMSATSPQQPLITTINDKWGLETHLEPSLLREQSHSYVLTWCHIVTYWFWLPWLPPRMSIPTGYGPCPTTNINFELNQPPVLTWPDQLTLTDQQLTWFEWHWPPDIWQLTTDLQHGKEQYVQALGNSSQIMMPGNSELAFLPSRRTCWRYF